MKKNPEMPHIPEGKYTRVMIRGEAYAVQASRVKAVVKKPEVRRVPGAPAFIEGVAAIDGRIVPVLNPVKRLDLEKQDPESSHSLTSGSMSLVMVEVGNVLYGLSVEHVADIMDISAAVMEPVNPVMTDDQFPFIAAMAKMDDQLVYVLNIDGLVLSGLHIKQKARDQYDHFAGGLTQKLAAPPDRDETKYLIFSAGRELFCMESFLLKSVVPAGLVEKSPDTPPGMAGLLPTLDGMLPVVDLSVKLGIDPSLDSGDGRVVVVDTEKCQYGVQVDGVSEFLRLSPGEIKPVPPGIAAAGVEHIKGIAMPEGENRMFTLLDAFKLMTTREMDSFSRRDDINMKSSDKESVESPKEALVPLLMVATADMTFALPIAEVFEVIRVGAVKHVPGTPAHILGLITVRGEPLPLMNLHCRLDLVPASDSSMEKTSSRRAVVIHWNQQPFAIEVDSVSGIVKVASEKIAAPPEIIKNVDTRFLSGLVLSEESNTSAMLLDLKALINQEL
ncbi:Chemotaxis signal transduction protein [Desulfocicer vacuolatum DSM 3385]|uniref:Chemotaxis signal transduction protein n=1 Tax=Desulfocicer vacuolatum DSM 3385 TaxID=1121400 RepID=A0A1W2BEI8_9BACT|nr:chemotaxis protein CheW [Desulfocicer vacuolatum]SMC71306.1 Chemotaxis signal transduction protein [Desulfocicer vacuolatum DSM 3385]